MVGKLSDRLLGLVLREERAGACVPENGTKCKCQSGVLYRFNCLGSCVKTSLKC